MHLTISMLDYEMEDNIVKLGITHRILADEWITERPMKENLKKTEGAMGGVLGVGGGTKSWPN